MGLVAQATDGDEHVADGEGGAEIEDAVLFSERVAVHGDGAESVDSELRAVRADHGMDEADVTVAERDVTEG